MVFVMGGDEAPALEKSLRSSSLSLQGGVGISVPKSNMASGVRKEGVPAILQSSESSIEDAGRRASRLLPPPPRNSINVIRVSDRKASIVLILSAQVQHDRRWTEWGRGLPMTFWYNLSSTTSSKRTT